MIRFTFLPILFVGVVVAPIVLVVMVLCVCMIAMLVDSIYFHFVAHIAFYMYGIGMNKRKHMTKKSKQIHNMKLYNNWKSDNTHTQTAVLEL